MTPYQLSHNRSLDPGVERTPPRASLRWGVAWGLWFATAYAAFAVLLAVMRGTTWHPVIGLSTWHLVGIYYAAGVAAGLALGLARPVTESRTGTFAIGVVAAAVCYAGFVLATVGLGWLARTVAYIPAVIGGAGLALVTYGEEHLDRGPAGHRLRGVAERGLMAFIMFAAMALIGAGHLLGW